MIPEFRFEVPELVQVPDWEKFYASFEPYLINALDALRGEIQVRIPVGATGNMGRLVQSVVQRAGLSVTGTVEVDPNTPAAKYAYYVENGRAPGKMPPWDTGSSLFQWVKRYVNAPPKAEHIGKRSPVAPDNEIRSLSFLIARAIGRHGTKAQRPFELGFNAAQPQVERLINEGVQAAFDAIA